jgi:two-component system, OmpR family, sensor histidine kinase TctE
VAEPATKGLGSLRRSILVWLVLATAAIGVLALLDTLNEARRTARDVSDRVLIGSAMSISEAVSVTAEGGIAISIPFSALDMLSSTAQDQVFYRVDGPGGLLTGYSDLSPAGAIAQSGTGLADATYRDMRVRTATILRELTSSEGTVPFSVTVAETTRAREALAQSILTRSALRIAGLILGAAVVAWTAATYALRPLDRLSASLANRAPNDMTPIAATAPAELRAVLAALNGYLARLSNAMTTVQNFAGNANHQIRTPLTVARTQIAMAGKAGIGVQPQPLERADQALIRIERVLEQLLLLARIQATGTGPLLTDVDVAALASNVTADLLPKALSKGQDLGYDGPASVISFSEEVLLGELLRNLVENAIAHCPPEAVITVHVETAGPDRVLLSVVDTGPPLPEALFTLLRNRIMAGGKSSDVRTGTRGLGLHIVSEIAQALQADLDLERGESGAGLAWSVRLPARSGIV